MSALFNFTSLLQVILLLICSCAYIQHNWPSLLSSRKQGALSIFWKLSRVGERASIYVSISLVLMALRQLSA